jgi:2,4-dienoyl-CoA reductase-like NADH-dependent reductase (Old Yellow Enzyme family)/thioredoxin reductase
MENLKFPHLFTPIKLGDTLFRNRIFGSPTGYLDLVDGKLPTEEAVAYYARKARGGAATVTVGECVVDARRGRGGASHIELDNDDALGPMTRLAEGISRFGSVAVAELQHAGMYAQDSQRRGSDIYGPVARENVHGQVAHADGEGAKVLAMTEEIIEETIEAYANAALFAKRCGFGMVLIHGGHGWLLSQFLSPNVNMRDDRWGGKLENRVKLPIAIVERIRQKCGPGFPIEFRMSVTEANPDGYGIDEGVKIAMAMDEKVDLIHCSAGHHEVRDAFVVTHPSMFLPDGANIYLAAEVKKRVKTPVAAVGAFTDPFQMEEIIASGQADVIAMARELIADPDMPRKAREGREKDITKCMRCFTCFSSLLSNRLFCCAINPEIGVERESASPAIIMAHKTVLVAGGGVAGMQAALTASERGHKVILCEKSDILGGTLRCEERVPFKAKLSEYLDLQARRLFQSSVDVRLGTAITVESAREFGAGAIIAALGAQPIVPKLDNIGNTPFLGAEEAYIYPEKLGKQVVILGGGLVGTELAIYLAMLGKKVRIIERLPVLTDGGNELHGLALGVKLRELEIQLNLSTSALCVNDSGLLAADKDGNEYQFLADNVIYAIGQRPLSDEAAVLRDCAPEFYQLGDCLAPKNIRAATRAAYFAAREIGCL